MTALDEFYGDHDEDYYSFGDDDDFVFDDDDDEYEERSRLRWLHPDCRNVCSALDLGTCCKYPDAPLVRVAVDFADTVARAVSRLGDVACAETAPELTRCFRRIPALLAQIHAVLPRLNRTALSQLLCPVGTLAGALDLACADDCPWGCGTPAVPDRRAEFLPFIELVAECSAAIRASLRQSPGWRQAPVVVRQRPAPRQEGMC